MGTQGRLPCLDMCQGDISAGGVQTGKCQLKWYFVTKIRKVILGEYDMISN